MPLRKSPSHCYATNYLFDVLSQSQNPARFANRYQPLCFKDSELEPSVALIRGAPADYIDRHPDTADLVIEVSEDAHDYVRSKLEIYSAGNVKECWLVYVLEKKMEIHTGPSGGKYTQCMTYGPDDSMQSAMAPRGSVNLRLLFHEV